MAKYTASDFMKHVSQTAAQAAATVNAHTDEVAGKVSEHVTKTAATTAAAVNAHTTKSVADAIKAVNAHTDDTADKVTKHTTKTAATTAAAVNAHTTKSVADAIKTVNAHTDDAADKVARHTTKTAASAAASVNAHTDDTADKLARHVTKAAATTAASVNDHVDRTAAEINAHADDNHRSILQHLAAMNTSAFVPLWYMLVSLLVSAAAGVFSYVKWLADMATTTTSEIKRDAMGNAIEAVTVTVENGYPKVVTILLAIAISAMVLGLLIGIGASIFGRRRHNDT